MVAPIVVVIVALSPIEPELTRALVSSCSSVSAPGGCVLDDGLAPAAEVRARVRVSFSENGAWAHAEVLTSGQSVPTRARDVGFRDGDPPADRFRAIGLVVAGLVAGRDRDESEPVGPGRSGARPSNEASIEETAAVSPGPVWSAAGLLGVATSRPRAGVWVGTDVPLGATSIFARLCISYSRLGGPMRPESASSARR